MPVPSATSAVRPAWVTTWPGCSAATTLPLRWGGDLVVVVVVPVRLDDEAEVEDLEALRGGDEDVAAVAGGVEAKEALLLDVGEDLASGRVEDLDVAVLGDGGAGLEVGDLDLLVLRA